MQSTSTSTSDDNPRQKNLPWIEKYRPACLSQVVSHEVIINSLDNFINTKSLPHVLFFGPPGSGKTSTIMCCAKALYGDHVEVMCLKLNASYDRGIDTVRDRVKTFVSSKTHLFVPMSERVSFKLIVLDEIDSMTHEAQAILRQIIERHSRVSRFCLICNNIDKIHLALQSRCTLYRFSPLTPVIMTEKLQVICEAENINFQTQALKAIVKNSRGDMRSAINTLQYANLTANSEPNHLVSIDLIHRISGYSDDRTNQDNFRTLIMLYQNRKMNLSTCVDLLYEKIIAKNVTIFNFLHELRNSIIQYSDFTVSKLVFLMDNLAEIEVYDAITIDARIVIANIAALFVLLREI